MDNKALNVLAGYDDETEKRLAGMQNMLYEFWPTKLVMEVELAE